MMKGPFRATERLSLSNIQSEVTTALERLWRFGAGAIGTEFDPVVELAEHPDRFVLTVELPGVEAGSVELTAGPSSVTISGEKRRPEVMPPEPAADSGQAVWPRLVQAERRFGVFRRTVVVPGSIQTDAVAARLVDGVLTVELNKLGGPKPVEIRVEVKPAV